MRDKMDFAKIRAYLQSVSDSYDGIRSGETLEEHRKHCEAKSRESCPYEQKRDEVDADVGKVSAVASEPGRTEIAAARNGAKVDRTDYGYEIKEGDVTAGRMTITSGYGDEIAEELEESCDGEADLRQIDPLAKSLYVEVLDVEAPFRGKGYAKKMLGKLIDDYGDRQIVLRAFDTKGESDQKRLVDLYKGFGFGVISETANNGVVMVRKAQKGSDGKESETEKIDREYAEAVASGNELAALKMVREAAARAMPNTKVVGEDGLPLVVYHGTDAEFNSFDKNKIGSKCGADSDGFFFLDSKDFAEGTYSNNYKSYACFVNLTHPQITSTDDTPIRMWDEQIGIENPGEGNDGFIIHGFTMDSENNGDYGDDEWEEMMEEREPMKMIVALEPNQIKSADITYDNNNLIPLSKRFDFTKSDIRY